MQDVTIMNLAISIAKKASPVNTWENPRVGAVLIKDNQILATGYHHQFGHEHAEMNAYNQIVDKKTLRGATLYVTLEPCSHVGKVGSCAKAITNWGLKRVVIGQLDPNPQVHGNGLAKLASANIETTVLELNDPNLNPAFDYFFNTQMPYVILKLAQSSNDKVTNFEHERIQLTDIVANVDVHQLRGQVSAILISNATFLIDKPQLNVRHIMIEHTQPLKIVVDRSGKLVNELSILNNKEWLIYTCQVEFAKKYNNVIYFDGTIQHLLLSLGQRNIQSILVEGGPTIIKAFLTSNNWQKLIIYKVNKLLAKSGKSGLSNLAITDNVQIIGNALKLEYKREN